MDRRKSRRQPRQRGPREHHGGVVQEAVDPEVVSICVSVSVLGLRLFCATLTKLGPAAPALDMFDKCLKFERHPELFFLVMLSRFSES